MAMTQPTTKPCDKRTPGGTCADARYRDRCGECGKTCTRCEIHGGTKAAALLIFQHVQATGHRRTV